MKYYNIYMKTFLKVFIVVILVIGSIAGTTFFFFRNRKIKNNTSGSVAEMLFSDSKAEFDVDLATMNALIDSDGTDSRMDLIIETNQQLDEIAEILATYYIQTGTKINNEKIAKALNRLNSSRSLMVSMIDEYYIKKESAFFDRHLGANDFYKQSCVYFVDYANFITLLNNNIQANKNADLKFTMIDVYANVVLTSFDEVQSNSKSRVEIKDKEDILFINQKLNFNGSFVQTKIEPFDYRMVKFIKAYYNCNKTAFAEDLSLNVGSVSTEMETTQERIASYYFKQIF